MELSIVLVIIGLIIGGVLVGKDLIKTSEIRAQISQIQAIQTAANTFKTKYNYLPGDIPKAGADAYGFQNGIYLSVHGDGNGLIENKDLSVASDDELFETSLFWADLGDAKLIAGKYTIVDSYNYGTPESASLHYPEAKLGRNNKILAWSGGVTNGDPTTRTWGRDGNNYLYIQPLTFLNAARDYPGMTVYEAYSIDTKIDNGLPQTGKVIAAYVWKPFPACCHSYGWAGTNNTSSTNSQPNTNATPSSSSTCYDNNNSAGQPQQYSISTNGGNGINCGLSFRGSF